MKALLFSLFFILCTDATQAQKAMTFAEAEASGTSIRTLDSLYQSALHSDSTKAAFGKRQEEFTQSYAKLLKDLNGYLHNHGYQWQQPTRCFNRIYFDQSGRIDYFLYHFKKEAITPEKAQQFESLLNAFIKSYRFPLSAPVKFAQCSPTVYND